MDTVFIALSILIGFQTVQSYLTDYTQILWLHSSAGIDPYQLWTDTSSSSNSDTPKTVSDLIQGRYMGYRYPAVVDNWATSLPAMIKVQLRNSDGAVIFCSTFNVTGKSPSDWYSNETQKQGDTHQYILHQSLYNHNISFAIKDSTSSVSQYYMTALKHGNGQVFFLLSSRQTPLYLQAPATDQSLCYYSSPPHNTLSDEITMTSLTRPFCSVYCRDREKAAGAVHMDLCSCLMGQPVGVLTSGCNNPCTGDTSTICGEPVDAVSGLVYFSHVDTDIDTTSFEATQTKVLPPVSVTAATEVEYTETEFVMEYRLYLNLSTAPSSIMLVVTYRDELCSASSLSNTTVSKTQAVNISNPTSFHIGPIRTRCTYIYLYDAVTNTPLTDSTQIAVVVAEVDTFVTASILSVEAAWEIEECECECWIYNMLYGESPYANLTYSQKEDALREATEQIRRELSVNKSELSSTKRKKISVEDQRPSATVIGYTLGVALLTISFGLILLADIPKIITNIKLLRGNLMSRFIRN